MAGDGPAGSLRSRDKHKIVISDVLLLESDSEPEEISCWSDDYEDEGPASPTSLADDDDCENVKSLLLERVSTWTSACKLKKINFSKENDFFDKPASTPIDYFNFFFEDKFLSSICRETNRWAKGMLMRNEITDQSMIDAWRELTVPELRTFLGLLFHMGVVRLDRLPHYWRTDSLFSIPVFTRQMGRNRFFHILKCLRFSSNNENEDAPIQTSDVIEYFNNKMDACYYPGKELTLDESMVLWEGRLQFRRFVSNERKRWVRLYTLTEPDGLALRCRLSAESADSGENAARRPERAVFDLMQGKLHNGHTLYMGKLYNSFGLARQLLENNTYCTGMLRKDARDNPKEVVDATPSKGENVSLFREGVHVGIWSDARTVTYITTEHAAQTVVVINKRKQSIHTPVAVAKYQHFMTGEDARDKLFSMYPLEKQTLRWHLKIAIHIFQLLLQNAFKMYNKYSGERLGPYEFRLSVLQELLPPKELPVPIRKRPYTEAMLHKICKIENRDPKGRVRRKVCRRCSKLKRNKSSIYHCLECDRQPGLCFECFSKYHEEL